MSIANFIVVLFFNLILLKGGLKHYKNIYNGNYNKSLSIMTWLYSFWGITNLIYFILKI